MKGRSLCHFSLIFIDVSLELFSSCLWLTERLEVQPISDDYTNIENKSTYDCSTETPRDSDDYLNIEKGSTYERLKGVKPISDDYTKIENRSSYDESSANLLPLPDRRTCLPFQTGNEYHEHMKSGYWNIDPHNQSSARPPPLPGRRKYPPTPNRDESHKHMQSEYLNTDHLKNSTSLPPPVPNRQNVSVFPIKHESEGHTPDTYGKPYRQYEPIKTSHMVEKKPDKSDHEYDYIPVDIAKVCRETMPNETCQPVTHGITKSGYKPPLPKRPPPPSKPYLPKFQAIIKGRREANEIRLVMVGRTGSGKSATGNTIMAKACHFESKLSGGSVTRECKRGECSNAGRKLVVVDTPGLFDTQVSYAKISKEIIRCVSMSTPGPHAFLLVIQISRFTDEEFETLNRLFELFGEEMGNFAIITFTKLDDLEREGTKIEDYIKTAPHKLEKFLKLCHNRYITFDNKASEERKNIMVERLIQIVDNIEKENGGKHYTNTMYKEAEASLQRKIIEVEKETEFKKNKEIKRIQSNFFQQINTVKEENKKLADKVLHNEANQEKVHREKEKANEEIDRLKEEMKSINKKGNEDIYRRKKQEKERIEQQAKDLDKKEKQLMEFMQTMQQQLTETKKKSHEIEQQKQVQLSTATDDHNKKMEIEIQRLVDGNNQRYSEIMKILEVKDKANERLQEQNASMHKTMREKDKELLKQQDEHRKQLDEQIKSMDASREAMLQAQRKRDKKQMEAFHEANDTANANLQKQIAQQKALLHQMRSESNQNISKQQEDHRKQLEEEKERNELTLKEQRKEQERLTTTILQEQREREERDKEENQKAQMRIQEDFQDQMTKQRDAMENKISEMLNEQNNDHKEYIKNETDRAQESFKDQLEKQKQSSDKAMKTMEIERKQSDERQKKEFTNLKKQYEDLQTQIENKNCTIS